MRNRGRAGPDLELAERHLHGDAEAFEEVYHRHLSMVFNMALRMSGSPQRAEDLTQEIFLRIFRHLGRFNGRSSLKTWVYRVTLNHCRSKLGRRTYPTTPLREEGGEGGVELVDERRDPEGRTLASDAGRRVAGALLAVKPLFREAVILRDIQGLAYDEIAEVLGVRIGTVRSRIARGRERLRRVLETEEHTPAKEGAP